MAIKITSEAIVKVVKPTFRQFSLNELNDHVMGWIEPVKIGPLWVMYKEKAKEEGEELNQVASFFFDVAIYGTVMIVPPQQMPTEWDLMDDEDYRYTSEQIETGFLSALQTALVYHRVYGNNKSEIADLTGFKKEEWAYEPGDEGLDDNTRDFFRKAYTSIITYNINSKEDNILFEDDTVVVKTKTHDEKLKTIQQMIDFFVEEEEYEKCAELKKILE